MPSACGLCHAYAPNGEVNLVVDASMFFIETCSFHETLFERIILSVIKCVYRVYAYIDVCTMQS